MSSSVESCSNFVLGRCFLLFRVRVSSSLFFYNVTVQFSCSFYILILFIGGQWMSQRMHYLSRRYTKNITHGAAMFATPSFVLSIDSVSKMVGTSFFGGLVCPPLSSSASSTNQIMRPMWNGPPCGGQKRWISSYGKSKMDSRNIVTRIFWTEHSLRPLCLDIFLGRKNVDLLEIGLPVIMGLHGGP